VRPYDRVLHDGQPVDALTRAALLAVEERLGYPLTILQGSYTTGVPASAGTHGGGGVVDLTDWDHVRKVRELRRTGFAAWYRPEIPGLWVAHIHAVLMGNAKLSPQARWQVDEYLAGRNGLADRGPDPGPRQFVDHRFTWRTGARRINRARALIARARARLASGIRGYRGIRRVRRVLGRAEDLLPRTD